MCGAGLSMRATGSRDIATRFRALAARAAADGVALPEAEALLLAPGTRHAGTSQRTGPETVGQVAQEVPPRSGAVKHLAAVLYA